MGELKQVNTMSNETSPSTVRAPRRIGAALSTQFRRLTVGGVRATAFWAAVLLPLAYVPAAYVTEGSGALLALLALHIACVVLGHEHNHPERSTP